MLNIYILFNLQPFRRLQFTAHKFSITAGHTAGKRQALIVRRRKQWRHIFVDMYDVAHFNDAALNSDTSFKFSTDIHITYHASLVAYRQTRPTFPYSVIRSFISLLSCSNSSVILHVMVSRYVMTKFTCAGTIFHPCFEAKAMNLVYKAKFKMVRLHSLLLSP